MDIMFVLARSSSETPYLYFEKAMRLSREILLCFLQLSDRAYVSRAQCVCFFLLLVVLAPHNLNVAVYAQVSRLFCVLREGLSTPFYNHMNCRINTNTELIPL